MRHHHHFNATYESIYSVEALQEKYDQGLADLDAVSELTSPSLESDDGAVDALSQIAGRYSVAVVSTEGDDDKSRLQKLLEWAKALFKRIAEFVTKVFNQLMEALNLRVAKVKSANVKMAEKVEAMPETETITVDTSRLDAVLAAMHSRHEAAKAFKNADTVIVSPSAVDLSEATLNLSHAVAQEAGMQVLTDLVNKHWKAWEKYDMSEGRYDASFGRVDFTNRYTLLTTYQEHLAYVTSNPWKSPHVQANSVKFNKASAKLLNKNIDHAIQEMEKAQREMQKFLGRANQQILSSLKDFERDAAKGAAAQHAREGRQYRDANKGTEDPLESRLGELRAADKIVRASSNTATGAVKKDTSFLGAIIGGVFDATTSAGDVAGAVSGL